MAFVSGGIPFSASRLVLRSRGVSSCRRNSIFGDISPINRGAVLKQTARSSSRVTVRMELSEGDMAPDFTALTDSDEALSLSERRSRKVVLYFYPKDDTPGCTKEGIAFRDNLGFFQGLGVDVVGVSRDDVASHKAFKSKYELNFPLVADTDGSITENYGVWKLRQMFGKEFMGIERSTFLIDEEGKIAKAWRGVKADGHVEAVMAHLG